MKGNWESVIGLEIHVQLNSESKIFSNAPTKFGSDQNLQACEVDLGMLGTLPVLNEKAIEKAIKFGVAINAEIAEKVGFARKNYFYPDLPKGYQISQLDDPIVGKGSIEIQLGDQEIKTIGITRAHLEEDAGKSIHDLFENETAIDLNRAGTPLLEIVSEPDMSNSEEAVAGCQMVHHSQEAFVLAAYLVSHLGNPFAASCTSFAVAAPSVGSAASSAGCTSSVVVASSEDSTSSTGCITLVAFLAAYLATYPVKHIQEDTMVGTLQQLHLVIHKQVHHVQR